MSITPSELQSRAGISKGYASELLAGNKRPSPEMALHIFRVTGLKLGPLATLSLDEIEVFARAHS